MNKFTVFTTLAVVFVMLLIFVAIGAGANNRAIALEEKIEESLSNIDVQRKAAINKLDGIEDALDSSNERYMEVIGLITEARQNDSTIGEVQMAIDVLMEAYPEGDVNNTQLYETFMNEIIIVNNKIASYREVYNGDVRIYKTHFRKFPNNIILGMMGVDQRDYDYLEIELTEDANAL